MKSIDYRPGWGSDDTLEAKFGEELHSVDNAGSYEVYESRLHKKGRKYYWLMANDCSCWDGGYDGWELTKTELIKLAKARAKDDQSSHETDMGNWILENIK